MLTHMKKQSVTFQMSFAFVHYILLPATKSMCVPEFECVCLQEERWLLHGSHSISGEASQAWLSDLGRLQPKRWSPAYRLARRAWTLAHLKVWEKA